MKKTFPFIALISLIILFSCSPKSKIKKAVLPDSIPSVSLLDSISQANSNELFYWTAESFKSEKSVKNNCDLDIKINRKVPLNFKNKKFILFPFFKKNSSNSSILMLHFLLMDGDIHLGKLKNVSFDNLALIESGKAYYYYGVN